VSRAAGKKPGSKQKEGDRIAHRKRLSEGERQYQTKRMKGISQNLIGNAVTVHTTERKGAAMGREETKCVLRKRG